MNDLARAQSLGPIVTVAVTPIIRSSGHRYTMNKLRHSFVPDFYHRWNLLHNIRDGRPQPRATANMPDDHNCCLAAWIALYFALMAQVTVPVYRISHGI